MATVHARALRRAAEILGGIDELAKFLHVPSFVLKRWVQGNAVPPLGVFLKAVDLIGEHKTTSLTRPADES
jgi:hypothetical protein